MWSKWWIWIPKYEKKIKMAKLNNYHDQRDFLIPAIVVKLQLSGENNKNIRKIILLIKLREYGSSRYIWVKVNWNASR